MGWYDWEQEDEGGELLMALASSQGSGVQGCLWGGWWEIDRTGQLESAGRERRTEDVIAVGREVS